MSMRNPMNERYTENKHAGATRRGAGSAKPKSRAASSVHVHDPNAKPKKQGFFQKMMGSAPTESQSSKNKDALSEEEEKELRKLNKERQREAANPPVPEYRMWRRRMWACIIAAIPMLILSYFFTYTGIGGVPAAVTTIAIGYALAFVSIWIEFARCRKIRRRYETVLESKASKREKEIRRRVKKEATAKELARQMHKEEKKKKSRGSSDD